MTWLVIAALAAWVTVLAGRIGRLRDQLQKLETKVSLLTGRVDETVEGAAAAPKPARAAKAVPVAPARPEPAREPARVAAQAEAATPPPSVVRETPAGPQARERLRAWLEENGLAWAGGAALALGGLFLVTYAAQRGVFTPPFRIGGAVLAGVVLLAVSEWLRRRAGEDERGHPLAAAVSAGAGAATLYGAAWASYWLYGFIGLGVAGGLMGMISLGLLALAFRHGAPLAVMAMLGAYLAPAVTGPERWAAPALTGYLALIAVTGYATMGARRWGEAGLATLVGATLWAVAGFLAEGYGRVAALALAPPALAIMAAEWRRRSADDLQPRGRRDLFVLQPTLAIVAAGLLILPLWLARPIETTLPTAAVAAAALLALSAAAMARRLAPAPVQVAGYVAAAGVLLVDDGAAIGSPAWTLALAAAAAGCGLVAALSSKDRASALWASGGPLTAFGLAFLAFHPAEGPLPWAPEAGCALLLAASATALARRSADPSKDLPLAVWIWTAGAAALVALGQASDPRLLPAAAAAAALAASALHVWLGWRGLAAVMLAAALTALATLTSPVLFEALSEGRLRWWGLALVVALSAGLTWAAAWHAGRSARPKESAEALSTGALLIALAGAFVLLRLWGSAGAVGGGVLDPFVEASVRSLLILAAGLTSAQAARADSSLIGRWRGQALLLIGLGHALIFQVALNPLVGWWDPRVAGPPILDSLFIGYLAPAALLAAATLKKVSRRRELLAAYAAGAGLLAALWPLMEARRLFQGPSLQAGLDLVGRAEAATYAVLLLLGARLVLWLGEEAGRRSWTISPFASQVVMLGRFAGWAALGIGLIVFAFGASPWWGPVTRPLAGLNATLLLFGLYAAGALAALSISPPAARLGDSLLDRASRMAVVAIVFVLATLLLRWGFRGFDMRPDQREAALETWAFSALWGVYGFGLLVYGAARRSNDLRAAGLVVLMITTAKIFLFDMARLDGVLRAASFLAVGALLLAAAVLVRRFSGGAVLGLGRPRPADG